MSVTGRIGREYRRGNHCCHRATAARAGSRGPRTIMSTRPEVIGELRSLFKDGATPSRLIRHIVERHNGERTFHSLIQAYFLDAFGVPIVRGLNPADDYQHADLRYAFLNEQLVHEMIQKRSEWDSS